jgi:hypothetical protein
MWNEDEGIVIVVVVDQKFLKARLLYCGLQRGDWSFEKETFDMVVISAYPITSLILFRL